jgi:hypothetical protein
MAPTATHKPEMAKPRRERKKNGQAIRRKGIANIVAIAP